MADWWLDDVEIVVSFRTAKDRVLQIQTIAQLCDATLEEVANKLVNMGEITSTEAKSFIQMIKAYDRHCKITPAMEKECAKLYSESYSDNAIAEFIGVTRWSVMNWRKKYNLAPNNPSRTVDGRWYSNGRAKKKGVER